MILTKRKFLCIDNFLEYKCDICDYSTKEVRYLKQHKKTHEAGKYMCSECDYTSHKPYILKAHISKKHLIENWCDLLDIKYTKQQPYFPINYPQNKLSLQWVR